MRSICSAGFFVAMWYRLYTNRHTEMNQRRVGITLVCVPEPTVAQKPNNTPSENHASHTAPKLRPSRAKPELRRSVVQRM